MKSQLRKIALMMAEWPLIGRFVRIAIAVIRLPELRAAYLSLNHRQHVLETEQLPVMLQTFSEVRQRQLADENLLRSVPVALRKITRDINDLGRQLENVTRKVDGLEKATNPLDQQLKEAQGQLESMTNSVGYLSGRVEFVRRELMFEMRYGASSGTREGDHIETKTEILNREKLEAAQRQTLRLNLGCGHVPVEGFLNVDRRVLPGVDIVAEVDSLPFEQGEIDEIYSAHLLEHFPQEQLRRELLPYWVSLLKPGGVFRAVVPDAESMIKRYADGSYPYAALREVTFGAQDYDGDFHYNMFVQEQVEELLKEAGLSNVEWLANGRKNGACFEMEFKALKNEECIHRHQHAQSSTSAAQHAEIISSPGF